jgi:predicted acylesterase/phospholipase RssA/CRP-like cAMP-binding protein
VIPSRPSSQDIIASLQQNWLFGSLNSSALQHLEEQLEPVELAKDDVLFHEGDEGDSLYLLTAGRLGVRQSSTSGPDLEIDRLNPGATVGEMALLTGQKRTADVYAQEYCHLLRLSRAEFLTLTQQESAWTQAVFEKIKPRIQRAQLARILNHLLGHLDVETLHTLQTKLEWLSLASGDAIICQGDVGNDMYIVVNGRLRIVIDRYQETMRTIGEVGAGDTVGEFALLGEEVRSATVYALRESHVVRLGRPEFEHLVEEYPQMMSRIARIISQRHQRAARRSPDPAHPMATNITFVPLSSTIDLDEFITTFVEQLEAFALALPLTPTHFDQLYGQQGAHATALDSPISSLLAGWMTEQEASYNHLVFVADSEWSPWTQRCIRQADRLVLVADGIDHPEMRDIERQIQQQFPDSLVDLVLLHPTDTARPQFTSTWLDIRKVRAHYHIRRGTKQHYRRLARRLTGKAVGLVLSGGGARGFAHIGAIRALQESGIEIDYVGGTSMGALIGGGFAFLEDHTMLTKLAHALSSTKGLLDYTLPFVSIMASGKITRMLDKQLGDTKVEDLWLPFFCVSSNLTRSIPTIHTRGLLRRAIRASISIPAVFSPVIIDGDVLVDGGVMNNFPVDVMHGLVEGGPVIGISTTPRREHRKSYELEDSLSGWKVLRNRLNPFAKRIHVPPLVGIVMRALEINSAYRLQSASQFTSLLIEPDVHSYATLDFDAYQPIIEIGYQTTMQQLATWNGRDRRSESGQQ